MQGIHNTAAAATERPLTSHPSRATLSINPSHYRPTLPRLSDGLLFCFLISAYIKAILLLLFIIIIITIC